MVTPSMTALDQLVRELEQHPVNRNIFFEAFKAHHLERARLRTFFRQYQYFCKHFVKLLEGLLYHTPVEQLEMRIKLAKTLHSELGSGSIDQAHLTLLNRFAATLGLTKDELDQTIPVPAVKAYLEVLRRLFLESDYLTALGSELAVEITAEAEFRYLYPGLKKYPEFSDHDLEFFILHVKEEECHGNWLVTAVQQTARSESDYERVAAGARETAEAWHEFWQGLYQQVFEPAGQA